MSQVKAYNFSASLADVGVRGQWSTWSRFCPIVGPDSAQKECPSLEQTFQWVQNVSSVSLTEYGVRGHWRTWSRFCPNYGALAWGTP